MIFSREAEDFFLKVRMDLITCHEKNAKNLKKLERCRSKIYDFTLLLFMKVKY